MARPGEGASLTLGEAASYARGRAAGLREAAEVANQHAAVGAGHYAGTAILAHLDGAAAGDARDAEATHWQLRFQHMREERDAARARIAELERSVEMLREAQSQALRDAEIDGRRSGAEAMREAAAQYVHRQGYITLEHRIRALPLPQEAGA